MSRLNTTSCCGLRDFNELISDPVESLKLFCALWFRNNAHGDENGAFVVFSDSDAEGDIAESNGAVLASYVRNNRLGAVHETDERHNPSSGNSLITYLLEPDNDALREWLIAQQPRIEGFRVGTVVQLKPRDQRPLISRNHYFDDSAVLQGYRSDDERSQVTLQQPDGEGGIRNFYFPVNRLNRLEEVE